MNLMILVQGVYAIKSDGRFFSYALCSPINTLNDAFYWDSDDLCLEMEC